MTFINPSTAIAVQASSTADATFFARERQLAGQLQLPLISADQQADFDYVLIVSPQGLGLQQTGAKAAGPVRVDFLSGGAEHRRKQGGGELLVKAVAGNKQKPPTVLDATAGLGRDSFVLASNGYSVTMCERSPIIAALLEDGLRRAQHSDDIELQDIISRMTLIKRDAVSHMGSIESVDAVLIDPMFPPSKKSALVKKEMQAFHSVVGADTDSDRLMAAALAVVKYRLVVKRPKKAEHLAGKKPNFAVSGKSVRFDIYSRKAYG
ncbi:MAG: 16S rRNA (guanine1516-N2)-methyltransferase [Oceanicoccus sp.]